MTEKLGVLLHDLSAGGSERIALRLAGEWARDGRHVTIICGEPLGPLKSILPQGVRLLSPMQPIKRGWGSRERLGAFAGTVCNFHEIGRLFIPGNYHFAALPALRARAQPGLKLAVKVSNPIVRPDRGPLAARYANLRNSCNLSHADALVAMSPSLADDARHLAGTASLHIIDEPILDDPLISHEEQGRDRRGIVAAGRFVSQKDFGLAVRAMAQAGGSASLLTILGDGPTLSHVSKLAQSLGIRGQLSMPGRVDDIRPWLKQAKVFLISSRFEGFPAVAIEALAAGARLVTTDCTPAIREIVTGPDVGEVVPTRDPKHLAEALQRQLLMEPVPDRIIDALHHRYSLRRSALNYLELFDRL